MRNVFLLTTTSAVLAVLTGLSACGGGGGDAGTVLPVPDAGPLAISSSNYQTVAQQSAKATNYLADSSGLVSGAQVSQDGRAVITYSRSLLARLPGMFANTTGLVTGVTTTQTEACLGGGSILSTVNDVNGNDLIDSGDSATLVASNCVESGVTINGDVAVTFNSVTGSLDTDVYSATVTMVLTNVRAATATGGFTGNGTLTIAASGTGVDRSSVDLQASALTLGGVVAGVDDTLTLVDWRVVTTTTPGQAGPTLTTTANGRYISSAQGGKSVTVATMVPFVKLATDAYASTGQFTATGSAGSTLRVTAQNANLVLIALDAAGDGTFETSVTQAWSALD